MSEPFTESQRECVVLAIRAAFEAYMRESCRQMSYYEYAPQQEQRLLNAAENAAREMLK